VPDPTVLADQRPAWDTGLRSSILVATLFALAVLLATLPVSWPLDDFAEYWAAGRLNAVGANPYDTGLMLGVQRQVGWDAPQPVMMYNPPWTLAIAMPLGALDFGVARAIWLPLQILIILWCAATWWTLCGGAPRQVARVCCMAMLWMPTLTSLRMGQLSPFILLGLVGFVVAATARRDVLAGILLSLTCVKPQLVAPVGLAVAFWAAFECRWRVIAGALASLIAAAAIAMSTNPSAFAQYFEMMRITPPSLAFESPNIATILRLLVDPSRTWPQYIPTAFAAMLVAWHWRRHRREWSWTRELPSLVILSCLATSYGGWTFDLIILVIPIVTTASILVQRSRGAVLAGAAAFAFISAAAYAMHTAGSPQASFIWMTPAVAMASAFLLRFGGREKPPESDEALVEAVQ
jgi:Glycosyltransferase family 87